jgi:hypothetical protein
MTARTERHPPRADNGTAGEGQKSTPSPLSATTHTERHPAKADNHTAGEGQAGMAIRPGMTAGRHPEGMQKGAQS